MTPPLVIHRAAVWPGEGIARPACGVRPRHKGPRWKGQVEMTTLAAAVTCERCQKAAPHVGPDHVRSYAPPTG